MIFFFVGFLLLFLFVGFCLFLLFFSFFFGKSEVRGNIAQVFRVKLSSLCYQSILNPLVFLFPGGRPKTMPTSEEFVACQATQGESFIFLFVIQNSICILAGSQALLNFPLL